MKEHDELIRRAAELSQTAPGAWTKFVEAFAVYTETVRENCIMAPPVQVQVNQGRAQNASEILDVFVNCRTKVNTIDTRTKTAVRPNEGYAT